MKPKGVMFFSFSDLIKAIGGSSQHWIGLHDSEEEDSFVWLDDELMVVNHFVYMIDTVVFQNFNSISFRTF